MLHASVARFGGLRIWPDLTIASWDMPDIDPRFMAADGRINIRFTPAADIAELTAKRKAPCIQKSLSIRHLS